jgi:hypothetical protein
MSTGLVCQSKMISIAAQWPHGNGMVDALSVAASGDRREKNRGRETQNGCPQYDRIPTQAASFGRRV